MGPKFEIKYTEFYWDRHKSLSGSDFPSNKAPKDPIDPEMPLIMDCILADLGPLETWPKLAPNQLEPAQSGRPYLTTRSQQEAGPENLMCGAHNSEEAARSMCTENSPRSYILRSRFFSCLILIRRLAIFEWDHPSSKED